MSSYRIARALVAIALGLHGAAANVQAGPISGQGTWESSLKARDLAGKPVPLNDPSAAFFYDTTANVTWQASMDGNGLMSWTQAIAWAESLTTGGFDDWRLPNVIDLGVSSCGFNVSGDSCGINVITNQGKNYSELAHLFYVTLGNKAYYAPDDWNLENGPQPGYGVVNTAYFRNAEVFMRDAGHWYGTEFAPDTSYAWIFNTPGLGWQIINYKSRPSYAIAVRSGDVVAVPEPSTVALLLAGLMMLSVVTQYRRRPI